MFSYGFVGLALFIWFLLGVVVRTWSAPGTVKVLMHSSLIAVCVMVTFYGLHVALLVVLAVVAGVLLRERALGADHALPALPVRGRSAPGGGRR